MKPNELKALLVHTKTEIDAFARPNRISLSAPVQWKELEVAAEELVKALNILLPPRGKGTTAECPYCHSSLNVTIT